MNSISAAASPTTGDRWQSEKRRASSTIESLDHDILCMIFSLLDLFVLVRCSAVCKSWNNIIKRSKLLHILYRKKQGWSHDPSSPSSSMLESDGYLSLCLKELAMRNHRSSLHYGSVSIGQWRGHANGVDQCRMKMGLVLTGVGDKVMRLWSSESYRCLEQYSLSNMGPLVDFDFDESKIVGLVGTRIFVWRRNGNRTVFPSREGTFMKGLCMRYMDPEAVVGCEDGTVRVFDMYSKKCTQIIRTHSSSVTCLSLGDNQLMLSGSSLGSIVVSGLSSDRQVATLRSADRTGIKTLYYNPSSQYLFAGSTVGIASCWDLRMMRTLWENKISPNVLYSMHGLHDDTSTLVAGGIDGILRILDQNTGDVLSRCIMVDGNSIAPTSKSNVERKKVKRISEDAIIDSIPLAARPPIRCLAVGMKKVVTTHNGKHIRIWRFR